MYFQLDTAYHVGRSKRNFLAIKDCIGRCIFDADWKHENINETFNKIQI